MTITDPRFQPINDLIQQEMPRLKVPGVAVGILHEGTESIAAYGVSNVEHPLPITPETLFQIGSITKTFTATAVARLADGGKIDLTTPVRTYLPDFKLADENIASRVTVQDLLTHVAGWTGDVFYQTPEGEYFLETGMGDTALARAVEKLADVEMMTPPGGPWSYNNAAFAVAARVIEVVTGTAYETALQDLVLGPLDMTHSYFFAHDVITHRFAVGHNVFDNRLQVARPWSLSRASHALGALSSCMTDMLKYARFHLGDGATADGTRLMTPEMHQRMQTPIVETDGPAAGIRLSWFIGEVGGVRTVSHGGATNGFRATFQLIPDRRAAVVVLTNSSHGNELYSMIMKAALEYYLSVAQPSPAYQDLPSETLANYAGRYQAPLTEVEIFERDGTLYLQVTFRTGFPRRDQPWPSLTPVRIAFTSEDRFVALDEPLKDAAGQFIRNADGRIRWLRWGFRLHQPVQQ